MITIPEARCIAKICCDGYLHKGTEKSRPYVRYNNTCLELLNEFQEDLCKIFVKVHLTKGITNTKTPFLQSNRKDIVNYFLEWLTDFRSSNIKVPRKILQANKEIKSAFLRSAFDDEGSVLLRVNKKTLEWKRGISFSSKAIRFLEDIKSMLANFDIQTNRILKDRENYLLQITGKECIGQFADYIGFKHPVKAERLNLLIRTYSNASPKRHPLEFRQLCEEMIELRQISRDLKENARADFSQV